MIKDIDRSLPSPPYVMLLSLVNDITCCLWLMLKVVKPLMKWHYYYKKGFWNRLICFCFKENKVFQNKVWFLKFLFKCMLRFENNQSLYKYMLQFFKESRSIILQIISKMSLVKFFVNICTTINPNSLKKRCLKFFK